MPPTIRRKLWERFRSKQVELVCDIAHPALSDAQHPDFG